MRPRLSSLSLLVAAAMTLATGCATTPRTDTAPQPSAVQAYELNPYIGKSYDVVGRIWTGSWRTAFWVPTYPTKDEAIAAMQTEAARMNADALISVNCLDQQGSTWFQGNRAAYLCYGLAIKLRSNQG